MILQVGTTIWFAVPPEQVEGKTRELLYGNFGAIVVLIVLSMRVWSIDVVGNESLSTYDLKQAAAECGLYQGMRKKDLEPRLVQQRLMAHVPGNWLGGHQYLGEYRYHPVG